VLAILTTCGLVATGPALAADDVVPIPQIPTVLDTGISGSDESSDGSVVQPPVPTVASTVEQPVTVDVQVDGGNVDVSVRVLSPGEDGSESPESAEPPVVSDSAAPGITTPTDATQPEADAETPVGSNVNVAVRVLSPGNDGAVQQSTAAGGEQQASEAPDTSDDDAPTGELDSGTTPANPPSTSDELLASTETPVQYHDEDSRYQSEQEFGSDPWHWLWYLSVDCDGNATSASTETGNQSSPDWTWEWVWEWACNSPARPPPLEPPERIADREPAPSNAAPSTSDGADEGQVSAGDAPSVAPEAQGEPWRWTWTFTFCGETTSATLPIVVETERHWDWDWTWDWTCGSEPTTGSVATTQSSPSPPAPATRTSAGPSENGSTPSSPSPAPATGTPAGPSENGSGETGSSTVERLGVPPLLIAGVRFPVWVIPLRPLPELELAAPISLGSLLPSLESTMISVVVAVGAPTTLPRSPLAGPAPAGVDVSIVIGPEASVSVLEPEERVVRPRAGGSEASNGAGRFTPSGGVATYAGTQPASSASNHATAKPAPERPSVRPTSPRREREPLTPLGRLSSSPAGGAGTSGGRVPTTPAVAVAALMTLFMLAAPGLGRRIRVARELSPRSAYRSSIDHPG
jgi:hypothetical protein